MASKRLTKEKINRMRNRQKRREAERKAFRKSLIWRKFENGNGHRSEKPDFGLDDFESILADDRYQQEYNRLRSWLIKHRCFQEC